MTVLGELGEDMYNLAIDGQGAFYGVGYGNGILYSFTADTFAQPTTLGDMAPTPPGPSIPWPGITTRTHSTGPTARRDRPSC